MKYRVVHNKIGNSARFLTIELDINEKEFDKLKNDFPTYTYSQLAPHCWKQSFFGKNFSICLQSNHHGMHLNPWQLHQELLVLKDLQLIDQQEMTSLMKDYCSHYVKIDNNIDWKNLDIFGAAQYEKENKPGLNI